MGDDLEWYKMMRSYKRWDEVMQDDVGDADMRSKMIHGGVGLDGAM